MKGVSGISEQEFPLIEPIVVDEMGEGDFPLSELIVVNEVGVI